MPTSPARNRKIALRPSKTSILFSFVAAVLRPLRYTQSQNPLPHPPSRPYTLTLFLLHLTEEEAITGKPKQSRANQKEKVKPLFTEIQDSETHSQTSLNDESSSFTSTTLHYDDSFIEEE